MQALGFDLPCRPSVTAEAEPSRRRGHDDVRTVQVRADLMHVSIDIDGGLPGGAPVERSRDTAHMDIGEEHCAVRGCGHGANPEWRSDELTVYQGRACVPRLAPGNAVEAAELLDLSGRVHAQDACIVSPDVDDLVDRHATCETKLRNRNRAPHPVGCATAKRVSVNYGKSAATSVRCERSDGLIGELLVARLAGDDEQPVAPCSHKHRKSRHANPR